MIIPPQLPALLTAIAALAAALAWPLVVLILLLVYRKALGSAVAKIPAMFDRVQNLKIGALEADLEKVASEETSGSAKGAITLGQVKAAAKIESQVSDLGIQELLKQLDRLCLEYDSIRSSLPSGYERTAAMTNILIKMRTLAPATSFRIDVYKSSGSPGSRLAAIAMMQMEPERGDIGWLEARFSIESPFVFYHAALALKNMMLHAGGDRKKEVVGAARRARIVIEGFEDGVPDPDTIEVLSSIE